MSTNSKLCVRVWFVLFVVAVFFFSAAEGATYAQVVEKQSARAIFFTTSLKLSSNGEEVRRLQIFLTQLPELYPEAVISGSFDEATQKALKKLQRKYKLKATGRTDVATRALLNGLTSRLVKVSQQLQPLQSNNQTGLRAEASSTLPQSPEPPKPVSEIPAPAPSAQQSQDKPYFSYQWRAGSDLTGEVSLPTPAPRPVFIIDGTPTISVRSSAATRLAEIFDVVLIDDEERWDDFSAAMVLEMIERLPKAPFESFRRTEKIAWRVTLTKEALTGDVAIDGKHVRITAAAFTRSNPALQPKKGDNPDRVFYSNRLFRAVLKAFYFDRNFMAEVMRVRFGLALGLGEPRDEFQEFTVEEQQYLASVLEDLPRGFHGMPGLNKIVRRRDGLKNPLLPNAVAIAFVDRGYMEFMDRAFTSGSIAYIEPLIAHEMTHFLWHKVLSKETQKQFMALSGWSKTPGPGAVLSGMSEVLDHPKSTYNLSPTDTWYRTTTTNFVSDYAAAHNPDEDFAETVSYFIYHPDKLRTRAPEKYNFVKNVVDGYEYVTIVDKQFTFEVFNLEPDRTYPGKIMGIDIDVYKTHGGDNRVVALLRLSPQFGDGAERAYARIVSRMKTSVDQYFFPVDENKFLLRADFIISKYAAGGYWVPEQITVSDKVDNRRYEGQTKFGWLMHIDNPEEDIEAPVADLTRVKGELVEGEGDNAGVKVIRVTIPVTDKNNVGLGANGSVNHYESGQREGRYAEYDEAIREVELLFPIRKYRASGIWTFREFTVFDKAGNKKIYDLKDYAINIGVPTRSPDLTKPTLDISAIKIKAVPKKPEKPDGETDVTIWYAAKDDNSGLGLVSYTLLKPNGDTLFDYHYHDNFYTQEFKGDPTALHTYTIERTLPPGSIPGTWILREIVLHDKAGNRLSTNFVETGILKPFKVY